jgi:hypothetical protein
VKQFLGFVQICPLKLKSGAIVIITLNKSETFHPMGKVFDRKKLVEL